MEGLEKHQRNIMGDDMDPLTLRELQNLEHQVNGSLKKIRSRMNHQMHESISELQKHDKALQDQNNSLAKKFKEKEKEPSSSATPPEEEDLDTGLSCFDLLQPMNTLNVREMHQGRIEMTSEQAEGSSHQNQLSNSALAPPWMLRQMGG